MVFVTLLKQQLSLSQDDDIFVLLALPVAHLVGQWAMSPFGLIFLYLTCCATTYGSMVN